jgi:hypothetical protein
MPRELEVADARDLEDILQCPVCLSVPSSGSPIYECSNGHIICSTCIYEIPDQKCPTCRVVLSAKRRNLIAEMIIEKFEVKLPCTNSGRGCNHREKKSRIKEHEASCASRPVQCPMASCAATVNFAHLFDHAKQTHKSTQVDVTHENMIVQLFNLFAENLEDETTFWRYRLHTFDGHTYIPIMWKEQDNFRTMLYIMAGEEVAKKQKVRIYIGDNDFLMVQTINVVSIDTPTDNEKKENYMQLTNYQANLCILKDAENRDALSFDFKVLKT